MKNRKNTLLAIEAPHAPEDVNSVEDHEEDAGPQQELFAILSQRSDRDGRLQAGKLGLRKERLLPDSQPPDRADIRQMAAMD